MRRFRIPVALGSATVVLLGSLQIAVLGNDRGPDPAWSPELRAILERFDAVQASIRTISADLKMTTVNQLLRDPVVYDGRFYMTKPDSVRWEFNTPEEMRFVIANDEYIGYYPAQKKAERKDIHRWSTQLFRYFGLGQGSQELSKFYHISLEASPGEMEDCHLLLLLPKKRRARNRVEDVKFWVDAETLLPVKVEYLSTGGNTRTIEFEDMRLNVELSTQLFRVDLPPDVSIRTGFSPFGGGPGS